MEKKFFFICGCPRSGTSALWKLFSFHESIAIGLERYILKCIPRFTITEDDFKEENFFTLKDQETHFNPLQPPSYYSELRKRYKNCTVFGDKTPQLYIRYDELNKTFNKPTILFIFRNILDVAHSYQTRFLNPDDSWSKDYTVAIKEWNVSLARTFNAVNNGESSIHILEYEKLFFEDFDFSNIFDALELEQSINFDSGYHTLKEETIHLDNSRSIAFTSQQKKEILSKANIALYKKLIELS